MTGECARAEILAGAIALNEATDDERETYRRHLAICGRCIAAFGGEREIERTMAVLSAAREAESWEPDVRVAGRARTLAGRRRIGGLGATATALLLAVGAYAIFSVNSNRVVVQPASPVAVADAVNVARVARSAEHIRAHLPAQAPPHDRLVVVHNVVTLKRSAAAPQPASAPPRPAVHHASQAAKPASQIADATVTALSPSAREKGSIAALRTQQTAAPSAERAESLAVFPSSVNIRDVFPLGGENAIVPRPAPIAYSENATGTTAFEVNVDERGAPVKCTITKASGYLVLDEAVCRAAMRAHYSPRTIDGRPVPSLYRDAFTFRTGDEQ